ncbi:MAG TPA: AAA family ATPase [Solirubrobacteraceae bacterium]
MLVGREQERAVLARMLEDARGGRSSVLLVHGPVGVGKSALLRDAAASARGLEVLRARGIESEMHLPFAGLADLLGPVLGLRAELPPVQARALGGALALEDAPVGDPFAIAAGVLSLLGAAAERGPLLVTVDDVQWLDAGSREALLFAARRLDAEGVAVLLAARDGEGFDARATGLERMPVHPLDDAAARAVLADRAPDLTPGVRETLLAAAAGNPLALGELARALTPEQREGRAPVQEPLLPGETLVRAFRGRIERLSDGARRALAVAACEESGRADVVAAALAGTGLDAAGVLEEAEAAGLLTTAGGALEFSHPLIRATAFHAAAPAERRAAHQALAAALPAGGAARAFHLAAATLTPDAAVSADVARAAGEARSRGAFAIAARGFARAAELEPDEEARARRMLEAAGASAVAGEAGRAVELADRAVGFTGDPLLQADLRALAARTRLRLGEVHRAGQALIREAERVETADPVRAATFMLESALAHMVSGTMGAMVEMAGRARDLAGEAAPPIALLATLLIAEAQLALGQSEAGDALLEELAPLLDGPLLMSVPAELVGMAAHSSLWVERFERAEAILDRQVAILRENSAAGALVYPLAARCHLDFRLGRWPSALASGAEAVRLGHETGQESLLGHALGALAEVEAALGHDADAREHAARGVALAEAQGGAAVALYGYGALGLLELGRGRHEEAVEPLLGAERAFGQTEADEPETVRWGPDLVEALWRTGREDEARGRLAELARRADRPMHTGTRAAVERLRGLMAPDDAYEAHFERALALHEATRQPFETARTRLLYGERLRRARRRTDARWPLRGAMAAFERLGAQPWAERARAELRATGGPAGTAAPGAARAATDELTAQELQIALRVAEGATNREVAAALFLSPKTIEHHLGSIYRKLDIRGRTQLAAALAGDASPQAA